jgi:hypothetical protein
MEQTGLEEDAEIVVGRSRAGWVEAFRTMAGHGDDELLDEARSTRWDEDEWR